MKKTIKKVWTEYNQEYLDYLKSIPEKYLSLEEWQDLGIFEADAEIERGEVYTHEEMKEFIKKMFKQARKENLQTSSVLVKSWPQYENTLD